MSRWRQYNPIHLQSFDENEDAEDSVLLELLIIGDGDNEKCRHRRAHAKKTERHVRITELLLRRAVWKGEVQRQVQVEWQVLSGLLSCLVLHGLTSVVGFAGAYETLRAKFSQHRLH
jgi:hypothetical protein